MLETEMLEIEIKKLTKTIELLIDKMDTYLKPIHDSGVPDGKSPNDNKVSMSTEDLKIIYTALSNAGYKDTITSKLSDYGVDLVRDIKDPIHYKNFCDWMVLFAKKNKIKI